jgi:hypothetical protein
MRKFNYDDNEDYREDVDRFFEDSQEQILTPEEYKALVENEQALQEFQLRLAHRDLNHRALRAAIRMCEKSFFWRFLFLDTRLKRIDRAYKKLRKLEEE